MSCRNQLLSIIALAAALATPLQALAVPDRFEWLPGQEPKAGGPKTTVPALPRSTADRADEAIGQQLHLMYVLPSDGIDEQADTNGRIATSALAFNQWLSGQTGGRSLRLDTFQGTPDITFVRLARSDAALRAMGVFLRDGLEADLRAAGHIRNDKLYGVYYGGSSSFSCGGGAYPPLLPGNVGAVYLKGEPPGAPGCATNPLGAAIETPGYLDFAMLHEVLHTLGFVPSCSPNHVLQGHVGDNNNDLMWAGNQPWLLPPLLDIGRNDYYQANIPGCLDLSANPYLAITPYQDLWWTGPQENGWGMTIAQHGTKLFGAFFIYDADGTPSWYVLPAGTWNADFTSFTGSLYIPTGSSYAAYDVTRFAPGTPVGTGTLNFKGTNAGTLAYTINNISGTKAIQRQVFAAPVTPVPTQYADLWWGGPAQDGWGVSISQQASTLFAVWFTYDASGQTTWFVMSGGTWVSATNYTGTLYRTTSSPWLGAVYDPSRLDLITVGSLSFDFTSATSGTMTYTIDGVTGSKPIVRQPF